MFDAGKLRFGRVVGYCWTPLDSRRGQLRSVESWQKAEVGRW